LIPADFILATPGKIFFVAIYCHFLG
jgi:hypothetical protein